MDLSSRIRDMIFGWDMHNFINDDKVDDKLEEVLDAIRGNGIKYITLNKVLLEDYKNEKISDGDICDELARYLREKGNHLIVIETPIPTNVVKNDKGFVSWASNGFGFCRITVMMVFSIETMREKISELEEEILEEQYQKQLKENSDKEKSK